MTTVATRARRISELEGFEIVVMRDGNAVPQNENGTMGSYPYEKRALSTWTVAEWKMKRFEAVYGGFTCDVLLETGAAAKPHLRLDQVRASYED